MTLQVINFTNRMPILYWQKLNLHLTRPNIRAPYNPEALHCDIFALIPSWPHYPISTLEHGWDLNKEGPPPQSKGEPNNATKEHSSLSPSLFSKAIYSPYRL